MWQSFHFTEKSKTQWGKYSLSGDIIKACLLISFLVLFPLQDIVSCKNKIMGYLPIFIWVICFLFAELYEFFILVMNSLSDIWFASISIYCVDFLFTLLVFVFDAWNFLFFGSLLCIFAFVACFFSGIANRYQNKWINHIHTEIHT